MRDRTTKYQYVTVRPLNDIEEDVLGDTPVIASDNRAAGFRMKMKVTHTSGMVFGSGRPGRDEDLKAFALVRRRDIPPTAPDGWEPTDNDLIELADGRKLFVTDTQPAWPKRRSIGNPDGGYAGWRLSLSDRQPVMSAATTYE